MANNIVSQSNGSGPAPSTKFATLEADWDSSGASQIELMAVALGDADGFNGLDAGNRNFAAALLIPSSRASSSPVDSADVINPSHSGVMLFLNTTVSTSGKTLSVAIQAKDPVSGNYVTIHDFGVVVTSAGSAIGGVVTLQPGLIAADVLSPNKGKSGHLPHTWRAVVTPSDATAWTYSLGACGLR
jgi:hypothetical protein